MVENYLVAVRTLSPDEATEILSFLVRFPSPRVRAAALNFFPGVKGWETTALLKMAEEALADESPLVRETAVRTLWYSSQKRWEAIARAVKDHNAQVRRMAFSLALGGDSSDNSIPLIIDALRDKDREIRERAFRTVVHMASYRPEMLSDSVIEALLDKVICGETWEVMWASEVLVRLKEWGGKSGVQLLLEALPKASERNRLVALSFNDLWISVEDEQIQELLIDCMCYPWAYGKAVQQLGKTAGARARSDVTENDIESSLSRGEFPWGALAWYNRIDIDRFIKTLENYIDAPDEKQRQVAAATAAYLMSVLPDKRKDILRVIHKGLRSSDAKVRALCLAGLSEEPKKCEDYKREILSATRDEDKRVKMFGIYLTKNLPPDGDVIEAVLNNTRDEDAEVREVAASLLGHLIGEAVRRGSTYP